MRIRVLVIRTSLARMGTVFGMMIAGYRGTRLLTVIDTMIAGLRGVRLPLIMGIALVRLKLRFRKPARRGLDPW
ncbi:hypothetical protein F5Y10DRAFT_258814 [Nemania abortiva]|nr:hypothetical protein F5Y10DRAFT_258814 [Nemania abortiva]